MSDKKPKKKETSVESRARRKEIGKTLTLEEEPVLVQDDLFAPLASDPTPFCPMQVSAKLEFKPFTKRKTGWQAPPTSQERHIVYSLACYGADQISICQIIGLDRNTFTEYFDTEFKDGQAYAYSQVSQKIYQIAMGQQALRDGDKILVEAVAPSLDALKFIAARRMGWKETQQVETVDMTPKVNVYIPDNGRDNYLEAEIE